MKAIIISIFGAYTPIETVVGVDDLGQSVYGVATGMAGVDWSYIAGVVLFAIVLFCFMRLIGVLLK